MNAKKIALFAGLATIALATIGQENPTSPPPTTPPPAEAPATPPAPAPEPAAVPAPPAVTPAPETPPAAAPAPALPPAAVDVTPPPSLAQNAPAAPAAPAATEKKAEDASATPVRPDEVVPLIVIDDVPLTDAIRNLARQAGLNLMFDPRVTAVGADGRQTNQHNVSIRFENVTAQQALDAVLDNYGLKLVKEERSPISRVTVKDPKAEEPLVSVVMQLKYADPTNLVTVIKPTLSSRATVLPDSRTSQIILSATAKELDMATNLIIKLDLATRQVLIEAQMYETAINPESVKGVDWSGTLEAQNITYGNRAINGVVQNPPRALMDFSKAAPFGPAFLNADGVAAVVSFLNKDNETEVVATPRAVTLDNQTATLEVTRAFPILQVTPGSANSPAGSQILYTNLGTILHVTPRITADDQIAMKVIPEVSNIDGKDVQTFDGKANSANIYAIRKIETSVMIPSGNTLVLGGMIGDSRGDRSSKVPLLGDIPVVGAAFRWESKKREKKNLMIFVTPTIIEGDDYHKTTSGREFLANRVKQPDDKKWGWFDSTKPAVDWTKPKQSDAFTREGLAR